MIKINPSKEDIEIFKEERITHKIPKIRKRMDVLWLKYNGLCHKNISKLSNVSINMVTKYLKMYNEGGVEKIRQVNFYRPQSQLIEFKSLLEAHFEKHPPASIKQAMNEIEQLTGLKRSETQIRQFLTKTLNLKRRKVACVPAKADLQEQEEFKKKVLEPRLKQAKKGERKVYFVDAAHFVLAPFLGFLWSVTRIFIKAPAGRKRFSVLGALDAITHQLYTVTDEAYINAQSVCQLFIKIAQDNVDIPITVILDNARYQKCRLAVS